MHSSALRAAPPTPWRTRTVTALALTLAWGCTDDPTRVAPQPGQPSFDKVPATSGFTQNDFYQCQTGNPRKEDPPAGPGCSWIAGNLNATHNIYFEGDVIPQKLIIDDATADAVNTLKLQYGFMKSGHGAYDFLAGYDAGTGPNNPCTDTQAKMAEFCNGTTLKPAGSRAFPAPVQGALGATEFAKVSAAWTRFTAAVPDRSEAIRIVGGYDIEIDPATYEIGSEATLAFVTIRFKKLPSFNRVLVLWGAHFADQRDWDTGLGAAGLSGSPFHTKLVEYQSNGKTPTTTGAKAINVQGDVVVPEPSASLAIAASGTNPVGQAHPVTATVLVDRDDGLGPKGEAGVLVSFAKDPTSTTGEFQNGTNSCTTGTAGTCTVHIVSQTAGTMRVNATASVTVGTTTIPLSSSDAGSSGPVVKTWVDAQIDVSPLNATNPVGEEHEITATVLQDDGLPAGAPGDGTSTFGPAPAGTVVNFSFVPDANTAEATFVGGVSSCTITNALGTCSVRINAVKAGVVAVRATTTFDVGGVSLTRTTGSGGLNSGDANKLYVAARISIGTSAVNPVGEQHAFTVKVERDQGNGYAPLSAQAVTATRSGGTTGTFVNDGCTTDAQGECTITVQSSATGTMQVTASATIAVNGSSLTVSTNGQAPNSGPATKRWVDAQIDVSPLNATNPIGEEHEITATVQQDDGLPSGSPGDGANGFGPAPNTTVVTFSLLNNGAGATFVAGNTCTITNGLGSCSVKINATSAGSVDIRATTTFSVGGESLTRTTGSGGLNSADANKVYAAARISIGQDGVNVVGQNHTFVVKVERDDGSGYASVANQLVTATKSGAVGSFVNDSCTTDASGQCDIVVASNAVGTMQVTASATIAVNGSSLTVSTNGQAPNSGPATKRWVQARLLLTPQTDDNLVGTPHELTAKLEFNLGSGFVAAGAGQTISLTRESGPGSFSASSAVTTTTCSTGSDGSCKVTLFNATTAGTSVVGANWTGTITATEGSTSASATTGVAPSNDDAQKQWVLGSITLAKNVEFGPFTTTATICFRLARTDGGALQTTSLNPQCRTITAPATGTGANPFAWEGLVAGTYSLTESSVTAPYVAIAAITGIVVTDAQRDVSAGTANNPLPPGALRIRKLLNGTTALGAAQFSFTVEKCGAGSTATSCTTPVAIAGSPFTVTAANNPLLVSSTLAEAYYRVTEAGSPLYQVEPSLSQIVAVTAGTAATPVEVTFNNIEQGDVCEDGKPSLLTLLYNGNGTLNDHHEQAIGEVIINVLDDPATRQHPVTVRTYDHQDKVLHTYTNVSVGSTVDFRSKSAKQLIPPRAGFRVFRVINGTETLLEHVQFHSSCSQPLARGDEFGSFRLINDQ